MDFSRSGKAWSSFLAKTASLCCLYSTWEKNASAGAINVHNLIPCQSEVEKITICGKQKITKLLGSEREFSLSFQQGGTPGRPVSGQTKRCLWNPQYTPPDDSKEKVQGAESSVRSGWTWKAEFRCVLILFSPPAREWQRFRGDTLLTAEVQKLQDSSKGSNKLQLLTPNAEERGFSFRLSL